MLESEFGKYPKGQLERHVEFAGLIYKVLLQTRQLVAPGPEHSTHES